MFSHNLMAAQKTYDPDHLQKLHPVPEFDGRIVLDEPTHVYTITPFTAPGEPPAKPIECNFSVTTFVKQYFTAFDADKVIKNMMSGASWKPGHKYWGRTPEDIKAEWSQSKAAEFGTEMHARIEKFYNIPELYSVTDRRLTNEDLVPDWYTAAEIEGNLEFQQFLDWHFEFVVAQRWIPWRTELRVFDTALVLAGSIDMIFLDPDVPKLLHIVDWKRSKEIKEKSFFARGRGPCANLDDCNYNHYALQVNTYAAILGRNLFQSSGYRVDKLYLAVFHPEYSKEHWMALAAEEYRAKKAAADAAETADAGSANDKKKQTKKRKIDENEEIMKVFRIHKYHNKHFGYVAKEIPNMQLPYIGSMMSERLQSLVLS